MKLKAVCCRMTMFFEKLRSGTAYEKNTGRLKLLYRFFGEDAVFYINGSQVLPSPLDAENEAKALSALKSEDRLAAEKAKNLLVERNLRLVVYYNSILIAFSKFLIFFITTSFSSFLSVKNVQ